MAVLQVTLALVVVTAAPLRQLATAAPVGAGSSEDNLVAAPLSPQPTHQVEELSSPLSPSDMPLPTTTENVVDPSPSPQARMCECCETQLRELVEEIILERQVLEDDEDQTPTRTK